MKTFNEWLKNITLSESKFIKIDIDQKDLDRVGAKFKELRHEYQSKYDYKGGLKDMLSPIVKSVPSSPAGYGFLIGTIHMNQQDRQVDIIGTSLEPTSIAAAHSETNSVFINWNFLGEKSDPAGRAPSVDAAEEKYAKFLLSSLYHELVHVIDPKQEKKLFGGSMASRSNDAMGDNDYLGSPWEFDAYTSDFCNRLINAMKSALLQGDSKRVENHLNRFKQWLSNPEASTWRFFGQEMDHPYDWYMSSDKRMRYSQKNPEYDVASSPRNSQRKMFLLRLHDVYQTMVETLKKEKEM